MKMKSALFCSFLLLHCFLFEAMAQGFKVNGVITSKTNGQPLTGATVSVKGTSTATTTNDQGNFTISVPRTGSVLVVSYAGATTQEFVVNDASPVNLQLEEKTSTLNEVVVIGYGTQRRATVTGAVSSVKADDIATVSSSRIDQAIQGRTTGVIVSPTSGAPGAGMSIRIRGIGTNGNANPLYVVDGVRTGGIDNIDPSEVASVEILKDGSAAAIYGNAAANGVVLITTKSGRRNSSELNYSMQYGQQSVGRLPKLMNAQEYYQYNAEAKTPGAPTLADLNALNGSAGTDWLGALFQNAPLQRHTLSFNGGSDKSTFFVEGTYFTQKGIAGGPKAKFDRYTIRINSDNHIKPWLNVGERLSYAYIQRTGISENTEFGSVVGSAIALDPFTPVVFTNGLSPRAQSALGSGQTLVQDANGNYYGVSNYIFGEYGNPLARIAITNTNLVQHKIEGNAYVDIEPVKGLKLTSRISMDGAFQRQHGWNPTYWFSSESLNSQANGNDRQDNWFSWQWENLLNYQKRFGDHNLNVLLGTTALKSMWNYIGGYYTGLFQQSDLFSYADFVPANPANRIGSNSNYTTLASYFGRFIYDYKSKYLFNASLRRDGNSVFAKGYQWGTFPAVSAGWIASSENFFSGISKKVNYLKFRAGWGRLGNTSSVGIGQYQAFIVSTTPGYPDANGNFLVGAAPGNLANPELGWETSEQIDAGADLAFLNNHLFLTIDYFKKTTKRLLTPGSSATPGFAGANLPYLNSGEIQNKGWEFDLTYRNTPKSTSGFRYEISGNLSTLKNEVTKVNRFVNELNGAGVGTGWNATMFKIGLPVWAFKGYKTSGIFQTQDEINAYLLKTGITGYTPKPGDPIVVDVNGDKQISTGDQTYIGNPFPKVIYGGRVNLAYKGFDLLVFVQGQSGNKTLMGFNRTDRPTANRPEFFFTNRWTGAGSTNTWFAANTNNPFVYNSDFMVFDGSYMRIRQLQLGYTFSKSILSKLHASGTRIYISLDDFFTFTKYPGLDPEGGNGGGNSLGIDRGTYPLSRKALVGASISF